jgi:hypothetical protein
MFEGDTRIHSFLIGQLKKMQNNSSPFRKQLVNKSAIQSRKTVGGGQFS